MNLLQHPAASLSRCRPSLLIIPDQSNPPCGFRFKGIRSTEGIYKMQQHGKVSEPVQDQCKCPALPALLACNCRIAGHFNQCLLKLAQDFRRARLPVIQHRIKVLTEDIHNFTIRLKI